MAITSSVHSRSITAIVGASAGWMIAEAIATGLEAASRLSTSTDPAHWLW
jgi:hypothetical protein